MADSRATIALDAEGAAAPPRRNGELVFETPWESRLLGITMVLHQAGRFEWDEFRARLIEEIARWERDSGGRPHAVWSYYQRWHAALEKLLARKGLYGEAELDDRANALATRPLGHDHRARGFVPAASNKDQRKRGGGRARESRRSPSRVRRRIRAAPRIPRR